MRFLVFTDRKDNKYDLIFVIVNWFIKIVYYKPLKITINVLNFRKVIIDFVI